MVPEKELGGAPLTVGVCTASISLTARRLAEHYLHFVLLHKRENPLQISLGRQKEVLMEVFHESNVV